MSEIEGWDALERELEDLGPLMAEQETLERSVPDPVFSAQLRTRLLEQAARRPQPRERRRWSLPRLSVQWTGLTVGALAAAAVLLLVVLRGGTAGNPTGHPATRTAWAPPTPTTNDITKGYPSIAQLGGGGPGMVATQSYIPLPPGSAFPGRIRLSGSPRSSTPSAVRAFRLQGPSFDAPRVERIAHVLGISGPVKRVRYIESTIPGSGTAPVTSTWAVVQQGPPDDLHSVAVSMRTGTIIYHGGSTDLSHLGSSPRPTEAVARETADHFLIQVGWPVNRIPSGPAPFVPLGNPHLTYTSFWWPDATPADLPAAAFYVGHGPQVKEGLILPPIKDSTSLKPRSMADAWKEVQSGKVPVGVEKGLNVIAAAGPHASGTGRVQHVAVTYVVTPAQNGTLYLVPAYRFSGPTHFGGVSGTYTWVAVVPAI